MIITSGRECSGRYCLPPPSPPSRIYTWLGGLSGGFVVVGHDRMATDMAVTGRRGAALGTVMAGRSGAPLCTVDTGDRGQHRVQPLQGVVEQEAAACLWRIACRYQKISDSGSECWIIGQPTRGRAAEPRRSDSGSECWIIGQL